MKLRKTMLLAMGTLFLGLVIGGCSRSVYSQASGKEQNRSPMAKRVREIMQHRQQQGR